MEVDPPWLESDTWYLCRETFWNARTGVIQQQPPDGLRVDGHTRKRSAPRCGPWAVPFVCPPPRLDDRFSPPSLEPPKAYTQLEVHCVGDRRSPVFTAPHSINLARDGCKAHLPEDFTSFIAAALAVFTQGCSVTWGAAAQLRSDELEAPFAGLRDPNYLTAEEERENEWVGALRRLRSESKCMLHVDVHGKRDREGEAACDVGVGACRAHWGDRAAEALAAALHCSLKEALPAYAVDPRPKLQGCWRSVPRRSLTQCATSLGYVAVQLELSYSFRRDLARDLKLLEAMAGALTTCPHPCRDDVSERPC
ncbi:hypothetical protein AB1Y20_018528 [Prymnesium parvum]|uniref:Uncharacterized protein n=1 Tax=Prymnesium parvum TaxID=97485 RepID=A0AB34JS55_PRYPA